MVMYRVKEFLKRLTYTTLLIIEKPVDFYFNSPTLSLESKLYKLVGIKKFRSAVLSIAFFSKPFSASAANYRLGSFSYQGLIHLRLWTYFNELVHLIGALMLADFLISTNQPFYYVSAWLAFVIDSYCIFLQRFNRYKINRSILLMESRYIKLGLPKKIGKRPVIVNIIISINRNKIFFLSYLALFSVLFLAPEIDERYFSKKRLVNRLTRKREYRFSCQDTRLIEEAFDQNINLENISIKNLSVCNARERSYPRLSFKDSNLVNSSFRETDLSNVSFEGANLSQDSSSYLGGFSDSNLDSVNFTGANILNIYFSNGELKNVSFEGANLGGARFQDVDLVAVDFNGAILNDLWFYSVTFRGDYVENTYNSYPSEYNDKLLDYRELKIKNSSLHYIKFKYLNLSDINLRDAFGDIFNIEIENSDISHSDLSSFNITKIHSVSAEDSNFFRARLSSAEIYNSNFSGANLREASLERADLSRFSSSDGNKFISADFNGASLRYVNTRFGNVDFSYANLENADLRSADLSGVVGLTDQQLSGENPPILCQTILPGEISVDPNRDCIFGVQEHYFILYLRSQTVGDTQ